MDITELLKLADALIFMKTGKHLDHTQRAVLEGTFQGKTYAEIGEETYQSEGHVRNTGSELWKILSEQLGQEITKSNCRAVIEKIEFNNLTSATIKGDVTVNNLNFCTESNPISNGKYSKYNNSSRQHLNLSDAPETTSFYDRKTELATLQNWILGQQGRLITLLGLRGIGKTTLALQLVEHIKPQFDYIVYRSLRFSPTPETTILNLLQIFSPAEISQDLTTQLAQLLDHLRKYRCLIILDDVQMLFASQQLAGHYKNGLENYQHLFKLVAEVNHHSCFLLNSSEKPREIANLEKDHKFCFSLVLGSLGNAATEILQERNLADPENWGSLIDIYQGNPLWLKLMSNLIQELCGGSVARFLQFEMPIISESLQELLDDSFDRLTEKEKLILSHLASQPEPVGLEYFIGKFAVSPTQLFKIIYSLKNRFLLEVVEGNLMTFCVTSPVIRAYSKLC